MKLRFQAKAYDSKNNWMSSCDFRSMNQLNVYAKLKFQKGASKIVYIDALTKEEFTLVK